MRFGQMRMRFQRGAIGGGTVSEPIFLLAAPPWLTSYSRRGHVDPADARPLGRVWNLPLLWLDQPHVYPVHIRLLPRDERSLSGRNRCDICEGILYRGVVPLFEEKCSPNALGICIMF